MATSIAEEGLDIMEVDLVICFDANVSPVRMIQRMGRTGRKRDGRVDILLFDVTVGYAFLCSCKVCCSQYTHKCVTLTDFWHLSWLLRGLRHKGIRRSRQRTKP